MKYYSTREISELAQQQLPDTYGNIDKKVEQYHNAVFNEILYGYYLANTPQIKNNQIPFNITRIRKQLGRYGKPQRYWWDWLHANFPLIKIIKKGNSIQGVSSMAEPRDISLDVILAGANGKELVDALYSQFGDDDIDVAPINMYSLENYILATTAERNLNPTIQNNLKQARMILTVARECKGKLPQVISHSAFGRTYYKGLNLQNVHKTVRHAALGACYSVDIDSSVFNWKYAMVPFQQELTYTRELIQDKKRIRRQLADLVFGNSSERSIKTVKQVLTAISFGAKSETKGWFKNTDNKWTQGAVSEIIYSRDLRDTLFNDPWMRQFMLEQERINRFIGDDLINAVNDGAIPESIQKDLRSLRGRISRGKLISWAYQQSEQQIMQKILEYSRSEILLQVHDGVYFKTKPDMPSMQTVLQDHWPLATLSIETVDNYNYINRELNQEHEEHIRKETIKANGGVDPVTTGIHTREQTIPCIHSEPNWDEYMQKQIEEYYEHFPKLRPADPNMPDFARKRLH